MKSPLDVLYELQLDGYRYNGDDLVAEVSELALAPDRKLVPGLHRYSVIFHRPAAHAVTEEFPAVVANWIRGTDQGFLRRIENKDLLIAMGLNVEPFEKLNAFALITAHEILVAYCTHEPKVQPQVA